MFFYFFYVKSNNDNHDFFSLLKVHLQLRGYSVFIDVERLEAGKFDNNLLQSIKTAKNFILVLTPKSLDRCIGDNDCKDWVHKVPTIRSNRFTENLTRFFSDIRGVG